MELEAHITKLRKEEKSQQAALDTLTTDLDTLEAENAQLKLAGASLSAAGIASAASELDPLKYDASMESSRLVQQIDSLRAAVRFLKSENAHLKSQDLLAELDQLPSYSSPPPRTAFTGVPRESGIKGAPTDPVAQKLFYAAEIKGLLHEARILSATPQLVDLTLYKPPGGVGGGWQPRARTPAAQFEVEKERTLALQRRLNLLQESARLVGR